MIQNQQNRDAEVETLTYEVPVYERVMSEDRSSASPRLNDPDRDTALDHPTVSDQQVPMGEESSASERLNYGDNSTGIIKKTRTIRELIRESTPVDPLNESENIVLLVDECHRSQAGDFHSNLMQALPNAAKIGFTGTPILRTGDRNTLGLFGRFLDLYTMSDSWRDGSTVEIIVEGRAADGLVEQTERLDQAFEHR